MSMNRRKLFGLLTGLPFLPAALKAAPVISEPVPPPFEDDLAVGFTSGYFEVESGRYFYSMYTYYPGDAAIKAKYETYYLEPRLVSPDTFLDDEEDE